MGCNFLIFQLNAPNDTLSWVVLTQGYNVTSDRYVVMLRYDVICDVTWHVHQGYKRAWRHVMEEIPGPTLIG